jgi:hypothetical protein
LSLAKIALGLAGILAAFTLSVIASGWDTVGAPYTLTVESNASKRAFELLNITLDRSYRNVTITISNVGGSWLNVAIGDRQLKLEPGGSTNVRVENLLEVISFNFESSLGRAEVTVYTIWREGVNLLLSLTAIIILIPSMIIASYGILEYIVLKRL